MLYGPITVIASDPSCKDDDTRLTIVPFKHSSEQNRLRVSCYVSQALQFGLTSSISISNNKYLAFTSTKSLFSRKIST